MWSIHLVWIALLTVCSAFSPIAVGRHVLFGKYLNVKYSSSLNSPIDVFVQPRCCWPPLFFRACLPAVPFSNFYKYIQLSQSSIFALLYKNKVKLKWYLYVSNNRQNYHIQRQQPCSFLCLLSQLLLLLQVPAALLRLLLLLERVKIATKCYGLIWSNRTIHPRRHSTWELLYNYRWLRRPSGFGSRGLLNWRWRWRDIMQSYQRLCCPKRFGSTACNLSQGKVSRVSTVYNFYYNPYNMVALVKQIFTQQYIFSFLFYFYSGVKGDYCGQNSDCQGNMKCHGNTQSARCR